ncbi:low temperature requirement protein A [Streptomyces abyssomicinicus]|uniref:low temperature requirement protein A n=1 Tax=Streptomyces abyssomicinicus TaxID=574929 RepID=UPI001FE455E6|nr:low temperature requirement protein A [Streptomyces abyssomicinicus]
MSDSGPSAGPPPEPTRHRVRRRARMTGRDPKEPGRTATPLELLFDLTFVVAVGTAASQVAEMLAEGHVRAAAAAFAPAMFAIVLAWINYSWFASAFGTDDWLDRVLTMVQMIGVVVLSLGLPALFHSVEGGERLELRVIVAGYVVMRLAMMAQWSRVAHESPTYRRAALANIRWTALAQIGWVALCLARPPLAATMAAFAALVVLELLVPVLSQGGAGGTPWHPHHVAERYGLFAIITLGEGVVGTVASSGELLGGADGTHWTGDAVAVVVAGVGLTFGMWWVYFTVPFGEILAHRRRRGYLFGYGHMPLYAAVAGTGAGLHVAGLSLEHHARTGDVAVVLFLALPIGLYLLTVHLLRALLLSSWSRFHLLLTPLTLVIPLVAVLMALAGTGVAACLMVVMPAPFVPVLAHEITDHRRRRVLHGTRLDSAT